MSKLGINTGSSPNDGSGDSLLDGAVKINSNFDEIYNSIGDGTNITNTIEFANFAYGLSGLPDINVGFATVSNLDIGIGGSTLIATSDGIIAIGTDFTEYELEIYEKNININDSNLYLTGNLTSIGIGTTNPSAKIHVVNGDIQIGINTSDGLVLVSPNGTRFRLIVSDSGILSTVQL